VLSALTVVPTLLLLIWLWRRIKDPVAEEKPA
jgi:PAT family beta-lactamase induction signal transducer AmpG